jgi:hypothetical protein
VESAATAEPSTAGTAATDAGKSMVALHAGGAAVMIAAENAVVVGIAALLESWRSQALAGTRSGTPLTGPAALETSLTLARAAPIETSRSLADGSSTKTVGHRAIPVRHA